MARSPFCFLLVAFLCSSSALRGQDDLASQMEKTIALLERSGGATNDPQSLAMTYNACAEGYIQRGDFATALLRVRRSLELCRRHGFDSTASFFTASRILSQSDDDLATDFMIAELQAPGAAPTYKKGLLQALGLHLAVHGDLKLGVLAAYELWQLEKADAPGSEAEFWALYKYGTQCLTSRLYDVALPSLKEAREIATQLGKPELSGHVVRALGTALLYGGDPAKALELARETVALDRRSEEQLFLSHDLRGLASTALRLNRFDEAQLAVDECLTLVKTDFERGFLRSLEAGLILKRSLAETGAPDFPRVIAAQKAAVAEKLKNTSAGEAFAKLGATHDFITIASYQFQAGQLDEAEATLALAEEGADAYEANSREAQKSATFSADQVNLTMSEVRSGIHEVRQQVALARGDQVAALVAAENGRGSAQAALLREQLGFGDGESVVKTLDAAEIRDIAKEHGGTLVFYSLVHAYAGETRQFFSEEEAPSHPDRLLAWVVAPDGAIHFAETPLPSPIGALVKSALAAIRKGEAGDAAALPELGRLLLDPLGPHLPQEPGSLVTFVPQGELFLVPFAALPYRGKTLLDHHIVTLTPSIELLRLARGQQRVAEKSGNTEVLLVGNPTMPGYSARPDRSAAALSPLPGAEAEVRHLASLLKADPLVGDAATETAVVARMEGARLLHFATHGLLETENSYNQSLLSSLAFAPSSEEDGFLTAKEVSRMKLRAELAVLSACDTGRGSVTGDGVVGLSRGFVSAGVPTLVVSLWPVSDEATAILMSHCYAALQAGAPKAAALRDAMLKTKERFPEPSLWAPFVLYGVAGP